MALDILNEDPEILDVRTSDDPFGEESYATGKIRTLVPGGTKVIYLSGEVEDMNGFADLERVRATFFRSGVENGSECAYHLNDCVSVSVCDFEEVETSSFQARYSCPIQLAYFADSTAQGGEFPDESWMARVDVFDRRGATASDSSVTREIQTLLAVHVPGSIDYGALEAGQATDESTEFLQLISQQGNDETDVEVSYSTAPGAPSYGGTMDCVHTGGEGAIPNGMQQWSLVPGGYDSAGTSDLTTTQSRAKLGIPYRHGENPSAPLYWNIRIPSSGVSGTCTGSVTISAVSH